MFKCERFDCPKLKNADCPHCAMPWLTNDVHSILTVYQKCRLWNALPAKGSMMDQPLELMEMFDLIEQIKAERAMEEKQLAEAQIEVSKNQGRVRA